MSHGLFFYHMNNINIYPRVSLIKSFMMYHQLIKLKYLPPLLVIVIGLFSCQNDPMIQPGLSPDLLETAFQTYKEPSLTHRRFKHSDIVPLIKQRKPEFKVASLGKSIQGRDIYQLAYGEGAIKV